MNLFKKTALAAGLAATALVSTAPMAMARDYHRGNDNTAAIAIGAGILGLAVGAIAASSNDRDDRYDRRDWSYRDRNAGRYSRDEYRRYDRSDYRRGYDRDWGDYRRGY